MAAEAAEGVGPMVHDWQGREQCVRAVHSGADGVCERGWLGILYATRGDREEEGGAWQGRVEAW